MVKAPGIAISERMRWWADARFGMFIHWGLYSLLERGEWVMYYERIPKSEYAKLADKFKPEKFDPDEWVGLAKDAGMKYIVFTSRHHEGFSLWDSHASDFTSMKSGAKRDFVSDLASACHRSNTRIGLYYSLLDWRWPEYWDGPKKNPSGWLRFLEYVHTQVRELMSNYGKIDILWYDGAWPYSSDDWQSHSLNEIVRRLQPNIIINNRSGVPEDFDTPEQQLSPYIRTYNRPSELNITLTERWWGYHGSDKNIKSPIEIIRILARTVAENANLLLNVGPRGDGSIPEEYKRVLRAVGTWLRENGESIYGAGASPISVDHVGCATAKGNKLYIHTFYCPGNTMVICGLKNRILSTYILKTDKPLRYEQKEDRLFIYDLPDKQPDPFDTVIVLELDGEPESVGPSFWLK